MKKSIYPRYFFVPDMHAYCMFGKSMRDFRVKLVSDECFKKVTVKMTATKIRINIETKYWKEIPEEEVALIL